MEKLARNYFRIGSHEGVFSVAHPYEIFQIRLQVYFQSFHKAELDGSSLWLNYVN